MPNIEWRNNWKQEWRLERDGKTIATITHGVSGIYGWHNGLPVGIFSSVEGAKRYLEQLALDEEKQEEP